MKEPTRLELTVKQENLQSIGQGVESEVRERDGMFISLAVLDNSKAFNG